MSASTGSTTVEDYSPSLGEPIPSTHPHAICVSLPTWREMVAFSADEKYVLDILRTGYPRHFYHKSIQELAAICERKFASQNERCILVPKASIATHCRDFMVARPPDANVPLVVRLEKLMISAATSAASEGREVALHIVLFPEEASSIAMQFWKHTGLGITSRMADYCLTFLKNDPAYTSEVQPPISTNGTSSDLSHGRDQKTCSEQYRRSMAAATVAKRTLRRRIAGVLAHEAGSSPTGKEELRPSTRGVAGLTEDDTYLFPTGMAAIFNAHQLCLKTFPPAKSVCFGFPYVNTIRILLKWGPGYHFFGNGTENEIDELESLLSSPGAPPILALFCEFPSNPLLRSVNIVRLRALADHYGFVIVVDETIGTFVNVEILPYADIAVSSLTKVFSGKANVMGGSLMLNPRSRYYSVLKANLEQMYEDSYWFDDAICMEQNSRDFVERVRVMNRNAEAVCDLLRSQITAANPIVKEVYYPKWEARANYDVCRASPPIGPDGREEGNFGCLLSVTFTSQVASEAFFDALPCAKGPSFGTNFTLSCAYAVLAHYSEMEWAAKYGVEESLIRISAGLEDQELLLAWIKNCLRKAEEAVAKSK